MTRKRIVFGGVSEIVGNGDLALLLLADVDGVRQISVVCDITAARQLELRMAKAPVTGIMLPEVLCSLLQNHYGAQMEIVISDVVDGQYKAMLHCEGAQPLPIRISDAVLMSQAGNVPLYIDADLMARQSTEYNASSTRIAVPINTLSNKMLDEALEKAIAEENYELASQLSKELKRREKTDETL